MSFILTFVVIKLVASHLLLRRQLKIGSHVRINGVEGRVTAINLLWIEITDKDTTYSIPIVNCAS